MALDDEESSEHTLLVVREVSVFKIPPRNTSGGYKCGEWMQSDKIWSGRLRVVSLNHKCEIRLQDSNTGELFAACHVHEGSRDSAVESVVDSSRYFVLRIDDGLGKHAFIGLGFAERNEAFDFNVALSDHEKHIKRDVEKDVVDDGSQESLAASDDLRPSLDLRLKEGETIRINVKTQTSAGSGMISSAFTGGTNSASVGRMQAPLAPPPGGGRLRSPLPPPPNDTRSRGATAASSSRNVMAGPATQRENARDGSKTTGDPFADLSQLEVALPSSLKSGTSSSNNNNAGWAAF